MQAPKIIEGKAFMWDGVEYQDEREAKEASEKYRSEGFNVEFTKEGGKYLLFTRKLATEVKVEVQS